MAADLPMAPPMVNVPPVDTGLGGAFYLRGSVGLNGLWARDVTYHCGCGIDGTASITDPGYGYSFGAGFGYETGTGLRFDATVDYLANDHLKASDAPTFGLDMSLRSTIALANVYYDFGFGGAGAAAGGFGAYVGAGLGGAYNQVSDNAAAPAPSGNSFSPAAAVMAGLTYDMGNVVADVGYRGIYMPQISNNSLTEPFYVNNAWTNEVRGTLRYRFY
jgi:hypothetical protein